MSSPAKDSFSSGDIAAAMQQLESSPPTTTRQLELQATIDYLQGNYTDAITGLRQVVEASTLHRFRRQRAHRQLALAYFQTNRFEDAAQLPLKDPLTRLMRQFPGRPYVVTWPDDRREVLPFHQQEAWELPRIEVIANGVTLDARIDTGGDLFSVPWSLAETLGLAAISTATGWYAGGRRARIGRGVLDRLELGAVSVENVPVSLNNFDHPIVGTGLLRQFRPTLDYPEGKLILHPRGAGDGSAGFPFWLASTHLAIATGSVNGAPARLLVDSGLEVTNDGCFVAPDSTLAAAGIPKPAANTVEGTSGAGRSHLEIGEFVIDELRLGTQTRHGVVGLTGIFPPQLAKARTLGFPLTGLVSHNFLRHFKWTINFDDMRMTLAHP